MDIFYVKETNKIDKIITGFWAKLPNFMKKIILHFKQTNIKKIDANSILYVYVSESKLTEKSKKRLKIAIQKKLRKLKIHAAILSDKLKEQLSPLDWMTSTATFDGKWLFGHLWVEVIEHIARVSESDLRNWEVSILINGPKDEDYKNIIRLSKNVKSLNIVTENAIRFYNLEQSLYNEYGINIRVVNNKRKSLLKSNIIVNLDFENDDLNTYKIPNSAILINKNGNTKIMKKAFRGICINKVKIHMPDEYKFLDVEDVVAYEAQIYNKIPYEKVMDRLIDDNIQVIGLYGQRGIISSREFKGICAV